MQAVWLHFVEVTSQYSNSSVLPGCPHLQSRGKSHQDMDVLIISILSTTPTPGAQGGTASRWTSVKGASCQTKHWSRGKGQQQRGTVYVRDTAPRRGSSRSTEQDVLNTDCSRWSKNWLWFQQPVYPNRTELPTAQPCNSIKQAKKHNSRTGNWGDSALTDCQELSFTLKTFPRMSRVWQSNVRTTRKQTQAPCNRTTES